MLSRNAHQQVIYLKDVGGGQSLLGCSNCLDFGMCGGLHLPAGAVDSCLAHCTCKTPTEIATCDVVCQKRPSEFVKRMQEVRSFDLNNIPKAKKRSLPLLGNYVPLLHGKGVRKHREQMDYLAIPMSRALIGRGSKTRARTAKELIEVTGIRPRLGWILSGTDDDGPIERIWGLDHLPRILQDMSNAGVVFATTPNYSLYADVPRHDNLHAMKRIAWMWYFMQQAGISTALHINGRTDRDFERWAEFVRRQPAVQAVAFEFTTGAEPILDRERYIRRLEAFSSAVGRKLSLVMRGSSAIAAELRPSFHKVTSIDSTAYQRSIHRRQAVVDDIGRVRWQPVVTTSMNQVAALFKNNDLIQRASVDRDSIRMASPQRSLDFSRPSGERVEVSPGHMDADYESSQIRLFPQ